MLPVLGDAVGQLLDALAGGGLGANDRHAPARLRAKREDRADLAHHRVGQRMVGLVDHDHIGDLHHPRLQRLDRVAGAGLEREDDRVGMIDDVDLALADANRLQQDVVLARRVHQQGRLQRRLGEAAERAAGRHRADEDARIEEMIGEADAVAEHRALGERARGVDRQHADGPLASPQLGRDGADQGALPDPRRAGKANDPRPAGPRKELGDEPIAVGVAILDEADRSGQRPALAGEHAFGEGRLG